MAISVTYEDLGTGWAAWSAQSTGLTIPAGTTAIVVLATDKRETTDPHSLALGGLALTERVAKRACGFSLGEGSAAVWDLLDISGRSNDTLSFTTGDIPAGFYVCYLDADADIIVFEDSTSACDYINDGSSLTTTLDSGAQDAVAVICGRIIEHPAGGGSTSDIAVYGAQVLLHESASDDAIRNTSYIDFTGVKTVGVTNTAGAGERALVVAGAYSEGIIDITPDPWGVGLGFRAGTVTPQADLTIPAAGMRGLGLGFRAGQVSAQASRQVMLTGNDLETPEMTAGWTEGQVLTQHVDRPPSWEDPGGGAGEACRWVPMTIDPAADGIWQLMFTDSGDVMMMRVMED